MPATDSPYFPRHPFYSNAQPGFLNASGRRGPAPPPKSSNPLVRFWNEEIVNPEKQPGNMAIAWGVAVALAGITVIRTVGKDLLVPAF